MPPHRRSGPARPLRWCGVGILVAALPTVIWRVVVGAGVTLGTPASWRHSEALPGSGTLYVCLLSLLQLLAALATVVLVVPGADRMPRWIPGAGGHRLPGGLVIGAALTGSAVLGLLVVLSIVHWNRVDPFHDTHGTLGWKVLC